MATKDITDLQVCEAYRDWAADGLTTWPYETLMTRTGQPLKVCLRAMERAYRRGLIDYGVSLRTGWLTNKGRDLLNEFKKGASE